MDLIEVLEVLDTSKICRTCLSMSDTLYSVFDLLEESDFSYYSLIKSFSRTSSNSSLPTSICSECKDFLGDVYEFKKKSETSYDILSKDQDEKCVASSLVDQESQTDVGHLCSCEQCEDKFLDHDMLKLHREEHGSENYKCKKCDKLYTRLGYLQQHIAVSHPENGQELLLVNYCEFCNKQFSRKDHLRTHIKNLHKHDLKVEDSYAAEEICDSGLLTTTDEFVESLSLNLGEDEEEVFNNDDELCVNEMLYTNLQVKDEPTARNDLEQSFDIDFDEEEEDEKPLIPKSDVVIKQEHLDFACSKCDKSFVSKDLLENHAKKHVKKGKAGTAKSIKGHQCSQCSKSFTRSNHLKRHELTHSSIKPFKCPSCEKGFTRVDHLNLHVLNHHTSSKPFECTFEGCKKGFVRPEHLQKHTDARHSAIPIKKEFCSICHKGFSTAKYLQVHMKMHSGDRTFPCKFCSETFTDKTTLADHTTAQHANEKPYLCCECGLRFVRNDYLVIHQRRHQGIKPYKCRFCQKSFPRATDLTVHERYHTNEKRHVCDQCGKSFQRAYNLLVHLRVHTGEKPYQCPHCVKAFAQGNDLKSHIRRHTGERFRCDLCPEGFIQGYHLTHHKRIVHGLDVQSHIRRVEKFVLPADQEGQEETWSLKSTAGKKGKKQEQVVQQIDDDIKIEQYSMPESIIQIHHIERTPEMVEATTTGESSAIQIIFAPQT